MPYEPDPETAIRVGWAVTLLGLLIFLVSAVGELLGWWSLIGEVGMVVGTVLSVVVGVATWFSSAGRRQLSEVGQEVRSVGGAVETNGQTLAGIETALVGEEGMVQELDVIQTQLDAQTGVLDEQLSVLSQIRDRI